VTAGDPPVPEVTLNNGVEIPQLGFGVFLIKPEDTVAAVAAALAVGYRHVDTAQMYRNEREVGQAVREANVPRDEMFITSKLGNRCLSFDDALRGFDQSLDALKIEYIDLYLIHWPLAMIREIPPVWKALERVYSEGRARAIGVSNFHDNHFDQILADCDVVPAVNQIEAHPYLTQTALLQYNAEHGVVTEAWSPLGRGRALEEETIKDIGARYNKTPAQVVLRWHLQRGSVVFPKSVHIHRMRENFELFDFALTGGEMDAIAALNRNERVVERLNPDTFDLIPEP
jgi:2,5-diketo-D-gluconate reductase A